MGAVRVLSEVGSLAFKYVFPNLSCFPDMALIVIFSKILPKAFFFKFEVPNLVAGGCQSFRRCCESGL